MAEREIGITIKLVASAAQQAVSKFVADSKARLSGLGQSVKSLQDHFDRFKTLFTPLNQAWELFGKVAGTIRRVGQEILALASEASAAEQATLRLTNALDLQGEGVGARLVPRLQAYNAAIQEKGIADADELAAMQAQLALRGVQADQIERATRATIGLSTITGDLSSASAIVTRVLDGNVGVLKRYGIEATTTDDALRQLSQRMGVAESAADSYAGRVLRLGAAWGDVREATGAVITQSSTVNTALSGAANTLDGLAITINVVRSAFQDGANAAHAMKLALAGMLASLGPFGLALGATAVAAKSAWNYLFPDLDEKEAGMRRAEKAFADMIRERNKLLFQTTKAGDELGTFQSALTGKLAGRKPGSVKGAAVGGAAIDTALSGGPAGGDALAMMGMPSASEYESAMKSIEAVDQRHAAIKQLQFDAENARKVEAKRQDDEDRAVREALFQADVAAFEERERRKQQAAAQTANRYKQTVDLLAGSMTSLFMGALEGGRSFIGVLKSIGKQLLALAANAVFKLILNAMTGGSSGVFSAIGGFLFGANGGRVPQDLEPRRYAMGGWAVPNTGSDRDVFPAMLRRGEYVQTPEERAQGGGQLLTVNVSTPINTLAIPDRATVDRHFAENVLPVIDDIRARGRQTRFSRKVVR